MVGTNVPPCHCTNWGGAPKFSNGSPRSSSANFTNVPVRALMGMAATESRKGFNGYVQSSGGVSLEVTKTMPCPGRRSYENGVGM